MDKAIEMIFGPSKVLRALSEHHSYLALERKIASANQGRDTVDRRKLKRIVDGREDVSLSVRELKALDAFFTPLGKGLADMPIFDKPAPLRSLAEKGDVTIAIGAFPCESEESNELNRWDVRALAVLVQAIEKSRPHTPVRVEDMRFGVELPTQPAFLDDAGPSVCCIGSPRSCLAAEFTLARMLSVQAFGAPTCHVPFRFIWSPKATRPSPSAFRADADQICDLDQELAADIKADRVWGALEVGRKLYAVRRQDSMDRIWTSHGVVLSQSRPGGQVWMVVAGMTGPATFACAETVATERAGAVPPYQNGQGRIRWDVVECTVQKTGAQRKVSSHRVVDFGWFPGDDEPMA